VENIRDKKARAKLHKLNDGQGRQEPFWEQIRKGAALGYRAKGAGSWIARFRDRAKKQNYKALGSHAEYDAAKAEAEKWFEQMTSGSRRAPSRGSVRDALESYLKHLESIGRSGTAKEARGRFNLTVSDTEPFGDMRLEDVTRDDFEEWRDRLRNGRQPRSVNRQVRSVVAALNCAVEKRGHVGDKAAWSITHLVDDSEADTANFLTSAQRATLFDYAAAELEAYLRGLDHTGARPSELARATVADFDPEGGTVTLRHKKGRTTKWKVRATKLSPQGLAFFAAHAKDKTPAAPLISDETGGHWKKHKWSLGIRSAITAANKKEKGENRLPVKVIAYDLRHTRISELLQVYKIDPLTVAAQTGTSLIMIEKTYLKFIPSAMKLELDAAKAS
jgi:integrase